ncbi:MAG: aminotransferase class III-fold pyridoxal phosphate-dependent enzyme [Phycisphaeraceae bacterium]|nr:aminotransferase class III-fold pyridoxal phosphate-dependent enzyme [Phycisphaeraceae bacterium]
MKQQNFVNVERSLADLLGTQYLESVCQAHDFLWDNTDTSLPAMIHQKQSFLPKTMPHKMACILNRVGTQVIKQPLKKTVAGAGAAKFSQALNAHAAPLSARGCYRIGEDGRLYLVAMSEHYHTPLGHAFPGYKLVDVARKLGIPNATHNNTRGTITRLLEEELIRTANGLEPSDRDGLQAVLNKKNDMRIVNRVLNLETGSLAVEAALKMILARFFRIQDGMPAPKYDGRIPVILVMGDDDGGFQANYHGTTVLTQMMRGMWPDIYRDMDEKGLWKVVPIRPNCKSDLDRAFAEYENDKYKIAGFFHEIIMMNYGGKRLTKDFLKYAHQLCDQHDAPTVVDEIQSCMWAPELYLFREYELSPTFVTIGKGFPGGEYPASRVLFSAAMDTMPQFGALVTNGQEELASLAYLITMAWAQANASVTRELGVYYEQRLTNFAAKYPQAIDAVEGWGHMTTLCFSDLQTAKTFVATLNQNGLDVSAQIYKANCPPVMLTKLPLIADQQIIDYVLDQMEEAMQGLLSH